MTRGIEGLNSQTTGTLPLDDVAKFLMALDLAIAPLLHRSGTRLKVLEYFFCGLSVVSTTVGD